MILLILSLFSQAEEPKIIYKKETEIDFEAVDVEGTFKKPVGSLLSEHQGAIFNPLVKVRLEWNQEMMNSVHQIE